MVPKIAKNVGISHGELYSILLKNAAQRKVKQEKDNRCEVIAVGA